MTTGRRRATTWALGAGVVLLLVGVVTQRSSGQSAPASSVLSANGIRTSVATDPSHRTDPSGRSAAPSWSAGAVTATTTASATTPARTVCPPVTDLTPITRAPGTGRTVALTFDDGPGDDTAALLEVLRADDVHATFFSIGAHAAAMPDLVAREAAGGNLVGDHTWDHLYPRQLPGGWTVPYLTDQLTRTDAVVSRQTGEPVCWFRPPGGFLTSSVWTVTRRLGLHVVMWSVDPQDWALQSPARIRRLGLTAITDLIVRRVSVGLSQEHPLILMHDGGGARAATVAAVSRIVALYRAHGYRFVRLDGTT